MTRRASSTSPAQPPNVERLSEVVNELSQQVRLLQEAVDELREEFRWALDNDRTVVWPTAVGLRQLRRSGGTQEPAELLPIPEALPATSPVAPLLRQLIEDVQQHMTDIATEQLEYLLVELGQVEERIVKLLTPQATQGRLEFEPSTHETESSRDPANESSVAATEACNADRQLAPGDIVVMTLDGRTYSVEVIQVDFDAGTADVCTAPSMEPVTVDLSVLSPIKSVHETIGEPSHRLTLFTAGDAVEFEFDGEELFGEIVALDDARNEATILLIPSQDEVTVEQDILTRVEPDPLSYEEQEVTSVVVGDTDTSTPTAPESDIESFGSVNRDTAEPLTIREVREFRDRLMNGAVMIADLRQTFERFVTSKEAFIQEMVNSFDLAGLKQLAHTFGYESRDRQRRPVALRVYEAILREFTCGRYIAPDVRSPTLESYVSHNIDRLTDADLQPPSEAPAVPSTSAEVAPSRTLF
ncbi:MAG: hypothetical protein ACK5Q5_10180 [Planctomycetaceae bacterium]